MTTKRDEDEEERRTEGRREAPEYLNKATHARFREALLNPWKESRAPFLRYGNRNSWKSFSDLSPRVVAYLPSPPSPPVSRVSEAFSLLTTSIVRVYMYVCVYIYIVFERVICCSIGRLTFSLDREEEEEEYFSSKRENNPSRFYDRERERERLYDVITFSQGDVKSLGSDTSFSREKERERRVLSYRGKIFFRGAFPVREIKEFEGTLNDTRRWQIRTSTEGEKRR